MRSRATATLQITGLVLLAFPVLANLVVAGISLSAGVLPDTGFLFRLSTPIILACITISASEGRVRRFALGLVWSCVILGLMYLALTWWGGLSRG